MCGMADERTGDLRAILSSLRKIARGEDPSAGRDEVAGPTRIEIGGMRGRALPCEIEERDGLRKLRAGDGEIDVRMIAKGEYVFPYGELVLDAPDRARGAAFVDAMVRWLGTPLDRTPSIVPAAPTEPIAGDYAKLGVRNDADGLRWDSFKLMFESGAEVFLRISGESKRAAFTEKWSAYRERLLVLFDRCLGVGRAIAPRTRVDVMGGATLTVPPDWIVKPHKGHVAVTDATDEAVLEVSHQSYPLDLRLPGLLARLEMALPETERVDALARAVHVDRGDVELAWTEYPFEATDTKTSEKRPARNRILIAANSALQVLVTFAYWPHDESWAVPEWETLISTLRLAGGPDLVPDSGVEAR